jgi:type IV pilus assembly protein PilA
MLSLKSNNRRKGFTLVELLVVVLILATLMAVALPLYLSSVADSAKKTCRANQQSIANAAQAWKVKNRANDFTGLTLSNLTPDLGATPVCPSGGAYTISLTGTVNDANGTAQTVPTSSMGVLCSFGTHGGFIPGVMSQ